MTYLTSVSRTIAQSVYGVALSKNLMIQSQCSLSKKHLKLVLSALQNLLDKQNEYSSVCRNPHLRQKLENLDPIKVGPSIQGQQNQAQRVVLAKMNELILAKTHYQNVFAWAKIEKIEIEQDI